MRHTINNSPNSPNTNTNNTTNNNSTNPLNHLNRNVTNSSSNIVGNASSTTIQPISHYQPSKSATVDTASSQQIKAKLEIPFTRNALSSSTYKKTAASSDLLAKAPTDLTKTTDFSKLKYAPVQVKARNQANLTSLALKPATVEGN